MDADKEIGGRFHPTQKPVKLMRMIAEDFSKPNNTVMDPFMGSGSTGIACKRIGRNFIGIEINPDYFNEAKRRIDSDIPPIFASEEL